MSNKQNIQETLISTGFQKNYIGRAFKVYEKNYGKLYNIEVITEIIVRLQNKDRAKKQRNADNKCNEIEIDEPITAPLNNSNKNNANMSPFTPHMTLDEAQKLRIHDKIDHRDQVGRFLYATVSEKQGTNLKIHYDGWNRKWDTWSDFSFEIHRFAFAGSISKRSAHRFKHLKTGSYIDINPMHKHPGWKCGEIRRLDKKSGQVQVVYVYESLDKKALYWTHLDNTLEIAEFTSRSGTDYSTLNGRDKFNLIVSHWFGLITNDLINIMLSYYPFESSLFYLIRECSHYSNENLLLGVFTSKHKAYDAKTEYMKISSINDPYKEQPYHTVDLEKDVQIMKIDKFCVNNVEKVCVICEYGSAMGQCGRSIKKWCTMQYFDKYYKDKIEINKRPQMCQWMVFDILSVDKLRFHNDNTRTMQYFTFDEQSERFLG